MTGFIGRYVVPPAVIVSAPAVVQFLVNVSRDEGLEGFSPWMLVGDPFAWLQVIIWLILASSLLMIPFDKYKGRPSPGHRGAPPEYTDNCGGAYMTETGSFLAFHSIWIHQSLYVYNNFPYVMGAMYVTTLALSGYIWSRASERRRRTTTTTTGGAVDKGGPMLYELCAGVDHHPTMLDFDVKQWTTVRVGFLSWQVLVIAFFYASYLLHNFNWGNFVTTLLQSYYVVKASMRESVYLASLDDYGTKPGFYLIWLTTNLAPVVNTFTLYYFVAHQPQLKFLANLAIFLAGFALSWLKFDVELQKDAFKLSGGNCTVWRRKATYVERVVVAAAAETKDDGGGQQPQPQPQQQRRQRLLTSGYWGHARHPHYVFEILAAVCWCLPGVGLGLWPFLPCVYVAATIVYRLVRDEAKCRRKYGQLWHDYCKIVKYRLIPYVF